MLTATPTVVSLFVTQSAAHIWLFGDSADSVGGEDAH